MAGHQTNRITLARMLLILLLQFSLLARAADEQDCPNDCGFNGKCVTDTRACEPPNCTTECKCDPGWGGADCDFQRDLCLGSQSLTHSPDGATYCFNGGTCKEMAVDVSEDPDGIGLVCDCSTAVVDNFAYAGHQCEYKAQVSCESGRQFSSYAFCVNGGICKGLVVPGDPHPLCNCPDEYEGRHCQFQAGSAPTQEQILTPSGGINENPFKTITVAWIVGASVIALVFVACIGIFCLRRRRARLESENSHTKPSARSNNSDLDLDTNKELDDKEIL